jgi:hypothetical protein
MLPKAVAMCLLFEMKCWVLEVRVVARSRGSTTTSGYDASAESLLTRGYDSCGQLVCRRIRADVGANVGATKTIHNGNHVLTRTTGWNHIINYLNAELLRSATTKQLT